MIGVELSNTDYREFIKNKKIVTRPDKYTLKNLQILSIKRIRVGDKVTVFSPGKNYAIGQVVDVDVVVPYIGIRMIEEVVI